MPDSWLPSVMSEVVLDWPVTHRSTRNVTKKKKMKAKMRSGYGIQLIEYNDDSFKLR